MIYARSASALNAHLAFCTGANPSAEDADEALEEGSSQVNNVVYSFRLQPTSFDKKSFLTYLKGYMKAVKGKLEKSKPDRVEAFEKGASAFAKKIIANFKDYEFYVGEKMDPEGMVALLNYREDGITRASWHSLHSTSGPHLTSNHSLLHVLERRP